jgi:hypothetical protein
VTEITGRCAYRKSHGVVVIFVRRQNVAQMAFAKYYDMIDGRTG